MNLKKCFTVCIAGALLGTTLLLSGCDAADPDHKTTTPTGTTQTVETTNATTAPTEPSKPVAPGEMTYEAYIALSGEEQFAYYKTFESATAFNTWYNNAKAEWEAKQDSEITDGNITLD